MIGGTGVLAKLGKLIGTVGGGIITDIKLGSQLPELFGGLGTTIPPGGPPPGAGAISLSQGAVEINQTINGGSGTPEQVGDAAANKIDQVLKSRNRQAMQQLTTAGATP